ncbi:hypothetical protein [Sphingopyxis witflariensis]|uniref:Uncharacterized protein n=1 Tax=Sphingopyxis witflariensis TaxID=173675 RepID=A0A246JYI0_9SPHN|nr:hypothetical protein [Sphingopyxis witflariensis]OWQ98241.1 hypothetical protein CDQ91_06915 [Sphingopyxis witflariensis]
MTGAPIRGDLGYYRKAEDERPAYGNFPRRFYFTVPAWTLRTTIESDELSTEGVEEPWRLVQAKKVELFKEKTPLPLGFSGEPKVSLSAELQQESDRPIGVISETGVRPFAGTMPLYISEGEDGSGVVTLHPPQVDSPHFDKEMLSWDIKLPRTQMHWLREELVRRPDAAVHLFIQVAAFQCEVESIATDYWMRQTFSFEMDTWTPIMELSVTVVTPERLKADAGEPEDDFDDFDEVATPPPPRPVDRFAPLQARLNWVIAILALILLGVLFG